MHRGSEVALKHGEGGAKFTPTLAKIQTRKAVDLKLGTLGTVTYCYLIYGKKFLEIVNFCWCQHFFLANQGKLYNFCYTFKSFISSYQILIT